MKDEGNGVTPVLEPVGRSSKRSWGCIVFPGQPLAEDPPRFENLGYPLLAEN
jgi:hypothetical protein